MRGPESVSYKVRLRELGLSLKKRRLSRDFFIEEAAFSSVRMEVESLVAKKVGFFFVVVVNFPQTSRSIFMCPIT